MEGRSIRILIAEDHLIARVGVGAHVAAITERAMRGEIAFEPALRERVALLAGLPETVIAEVLDSAITLTPGGFWSSTGPEIKVTSAPAACAAPAMAKPCLPEERLAM